MLKYAKIYHRAWICKKRETARKYRLCNDRKGYTKI